MPVWLTFAAGSRVYKAGISEWKDKGFCEIYFSPFGSHGEVGHSK